MELWLGINEQQARLGKQKGRLMLLAAASPFKWPGVKLSVSVTIAEGVGTSH